MRLGAPLVALSLVLAACGGGSDNTATGDLADTGDDASSGDDSASPVLTATDTGVTAEVIRLGAMFPDLSIVGRNNGDVEAKLQVAVDAVNRSGGINGRTIELHFETYNPLDDDDFDAGCAILTEDVEVFAVIGIFLREQVLCFTQLHDTIAVNFLSIEDAQIEKSAAPLLAIPANSSRTIDSNVSALFDNRLLEPGDPVAVHGSSTDQELHEAYVDALTAAGVDIVANTLRTQQTDIQAGLQEGRVFAENWSASGAVALIGTVDVVAGDLFAASENAGLDLPILLPEGLDRPPSLITSSLGTSTAFGLGIPLIQDEGFINQWADDVNGVRECAARFEAESGETIYTTEEGDEPLENLGPTSLACALVELFTAVAVEAGPELTTETFSTAAETIGEFTITGVTAGSLGPGKPDYTDVQPRVGRYNADTNQFDAVD